MSGLTGKGPASSRPGAGAGVASHGRACYRSRVAPEPFFPEALPVPPDAGKRLRALDKVELHQHVDGSIPADVTWELMHHYRLNPVDSLDEMRRHLEIQEGEEGTLLAYLDKMHYPLWVTQFYENISKVVEEIALAAAAMGVKTLELRYAPLIHTYAGLTPRQSIRAALSGMNRAQRKNPEMKFGLIVITMRQHGPHIAKILARQALAEAQHLHERTGVVGFDIAGPERGNPPRLFRSAYEIARLGRLGLTAHAGEDAPTDYVWQAVDELGVDRIGHGCAAARDAELLKRLARDKTAVEVCLSSNYHTGAVRRGTRHPLHAFLEAGVPVALCSDNSTVSRTDALRESLLAAAQVGLDAVIDIHEAARAHTFIRPQTALPGRPDP
jgi:adenosine deaminase